MVRFPGINGGPSDKEILSYLNLRRTLVRCHFLARFRSLPPGLVY
jgi:hypothetical protein